MDEELIYQFNTEIKELKNEIHFLQKRVKKLEEERKEHDDGK